MKKVVIVLSFILSIVLLIPQDINATTLQEYEDQLEKYKNELNDKNNQIAASKKELEEVQQKLADYEKQIKDTEEAIKKIEEEIKKNNEEIENKKKESKKLMEYYQISNGENVYLEYAFGATDITDMIYRLSIVEQLTDYNDKVMKELKELVRQNQEKQKELENKKVELNKLTEEMREQSKKIKGNISSMEGTVPNIKGQLSYYQERVSYYKSVGCKSSDTIGIDCDKPKRVSRGGGGGGGGGGYLIGANGFASPLNSYNYISTGFYWNGYSGHKGLDFAEGCGTPVRAVATGRVYYVGSNKDIYGAKMVMIVHNYNGRLVFSQYAHLSGYAVSTNQDVYVGQVIGYVGSTGWSTGCHLHLEMSNDVGWDYNRPGNYYTYINYITNPYNYIPG